MTREEILRKEFDIFIAYHGTNNPMGSKQKAWELYEHLSQFADCFFLPVTYPEGDFSDTPTIAKHARLFLLVANDNIPLNDKNEIDATDDNWLHPEVSSYYSAHVARKAKVYACGGLTAAKANNFHVAFGGTAHFVEGESVDPLRELTLWAQTALQNCSTAAPAVVKPSVPAYRADKRVFEGTWILTGEFKGFQGDFRHHYTSMGRLILTWDSHCYKALYCYSVSRDFSDQAHVTAICEGFSSFEIGEDGKEQLVITCDILGRTSAKKQRNNNKHFRLVLTPKLGADGSIIALVSEFKTKNTDGTLTFTKGR